MRIDVLFQDFVLSVEQARQRRCQLLRVRQLLIGLFPDLGLILQCLLVFFELVEERLEFRVIYIDR